MRLKYLTQEHNAGTGLDHTPHDPETSALTTRPQRLYGNTARVKRISYLRWTVFKCKPSLEVKLGIPCSRYNLCLDVHFKIHGILAIDILAVQNKWFINQNNAQQRMNSAKTKPNKEIKQPTFIFVFLFAMSAANRID